jgi:hypothetical protein
VNRIPAVGSTEQELQLGKDKYMSKHFLAVALAAASTPFLFAATPQSNPPANATNTHKATVSTNTKKHKKHIKKAVKSTTAAKPAK